MHWLAILYLVTEGEHVFVIQDNGSQNFVLLKKMIIIINHSNAQIRRRVNQINWMKIL